MLYPSPQVARVWFPWKLTEGLCVAIGGIHRLILSNRPWTVIAKALSSRFHLSILDPTAHDWVKVLDRHRYGQFSAACSFWEWLRARACLW